MTARESAAGRVNVNPAGVWRSTGFPMNQGVVEPDGRRLHLTGQVAWDADLVVQGVGDAAAQTRYALENLRRVLADVGGDLDDIVALTTYYVRSEDRDPITRARRELLTAEFGPAATGIQVAGLWHADLLVELTATAVVPWSRFRAPPGS